MSSRLDGHFVQGHVDATGICIDISNKEGSYEFEFSFPENFASLVIEKGSICINGVSLTAWDVKKTSLKVAIIPYTYQNTNFQQLRTADRVNLEFDLIGKYIVRKLNL
jgi:riboflavin synthase